MRHSLILAILAVTIPAIAADSSIPISVDTTAVSNANLSGTPTTSAIDMEETRATNQLALTLSVTPGSTTAVVVKCYESSNRSVWGQIGFCNTATPTSECQPDARQFTLANYTTVGSLKLIASRWDVKQRWVKCSAYGAGTGKVSISGARSWQ